MRSTVATIDLSALVWNYQHLQEFTEKTIFPVVKANAYGHGILEISKEFDAMDVPFLCVSSIDEALVLYEAGIRSDILIFSYVDTHSIEKYHQKQFVYTATSMAWCEAVERLAFQIRYHIEVNVGMNRYGIKPNDLEEIENTQHCIEGIYTHFSSPLSNDTIDAQIARFETVVKNAKLEYRWVHCGNAPLEVMKACEWIHACRVGLGLYGYRHDVKDLKPVLSLSTRIHHVDHLYAGETVGYEETYTAQEDACFASVPLGYGDGFDLRNSGDGLYVNETSYPIIGKVCMDQTMLLVDDCVKIGDRVEIIGVQRTCYDISQYTQISIYVLLTSISTRVKREYMHSEIL